MYKTKNKAFTLVELIVVITILSILWTIAFISYQWYSRSSRDSVRISDIKNISKSLELFQVNSWKYPDPNLSFPVTYNWIEVRSQWIFWEKNFINVWKLNKLPKDPLFDVEYTYSLLNTKKEFELWAVMETLNEQVNIINITNAENNIKVINYIKWNYNWKIARVQVWNEIHVLAIPSIINWQVWLIDIFDLINQWLMSHNKNSIIPWSFKWIINNNWSTRIIVNTWSLIVYTWTINDLWNPNDPAKRLVLLKWIQNAYSWTLLSNSHWIKEIIDLWEINLSNPSELQINLAWINANLIPWVKVDVKPVYASVSWDWWAWAWWWGQWNWWSIEYSCNNVLWVLLTDYSWYPDFELCVNTIMINSFDSILPSSNLTGNDWARDVYAVLLEAWKSYVFETLWDDYDTDTAMILFDSNWLELIMNDDMDTGPYRSKFLYNVTQTWYYFVWIMWYQDYWLWVDYTLSIVPWWSCLAQPNLPNAEFTMWIPTSNNVAWKKWDYHSSNNPTECLYKCKTWYIWNDCNQPVYKTIASCTAAWQKLLWASTYSTCNQADIIICSWVWKWYTISSCNIWTSNSSTDWNSSWWNYFQWWNNLATNWYDWFTYTLANASWYWPGNYFSSTSFIFWSTDNKWDWTSVKNDNLWWYIDYINWSFNNNLLQWPCQAWYHIPIIEEWYWLASAGWWNSIWYSWNSMKTDLKLPLPGMRVQTHWWLATHWWYWYYQTSTPSWDTWYNAAYNFVINNWTDYYHINETWRTAWTSIRCFKN